MSAGGRRILVCLNDPAHKRSVFASNKAIFCSDICRASYARKPRIIKERFWSLVHILGEDDCWIFTGSVHDKQGYCSFCYTLKEHCTKQVLAHRFSYMISKGKIPFGMQVLHTCDNPPCVNPSHLFLGDNYANVLDKVQKNRQQMGEDVKRGKLKEKDVIEILMILKHGYAKLHKEIADRFGVFPVNIDAIAEGRHWKQITRNR